MFRQSLLLISEKGRPSLNSCSGCLIIPPTSPWGPELLFLVFVVTKWLGFLASHFSRRPLTKTLCLLKGSPHFSWRDHASEDIKVSSRVLLKKQHRGLSCPQNKWFTEEVAAENKAASWTACGPADRAEPWQESGSPCRLLGWRWNEGEANVPLQLYF